MSGYIPPVGFHFRVDFVLPFMTSNDNRFQEVSGLTAEIDVETVNAGGQNKYTHKLPKRGKYPNLVLKRGMLKNSSLIAWLTNSIVNFEFVPANLIVTLLNENHMPVTAWMVKKIWPVKWSFSDLKADENGIVIETIELAYDFFVKI
ncbi:MAG: phage tail protein [Lentisphaeraceae bacterium]|nr:phage tail protein [Lentisphaeraceae bacterium]